MRCPWIKRGIDIECEHRRHMEDIPQPSVSPYSVGDLVEVYIDSADHDSQFHGAKCEIVGVLKDDLGQETGRPTDDYKYTVQKSQTNDKLVTPFRHRDLVPVGKD